MVVKVVKVECYYNDKGRAFKEAVQLAITHKYDGIYVFKPDYAETPIKDFYYHVVCYMGNFDVMSEDHKHKLWDLTQDWLEKDYNSLSNKIKRLWYKLTYKEAV